MATTIVHEKTVDVSDSQDADFLIVHLPDNTRIWFTRVNRGWVRYESTNES